MSVAPVLPAPEEFRRSGAPPRRRRRNPILALLRPLAVSLLLVAMPASLVTWVLASSRFDLAEVIVAAGTPRIPAEALRAAVAPFEGGNLVLLPLEKVEAAVRRNPWVDTVEVAKELPDRLRVEVTERRPVALLVRGGGLVYADEKGRPIAPVEDPGQARKGGLVVVAFAHPQLSPSDGVGGALEVAGELGRVQPSWAGALSRIEVLGEQDFRLHTGALRFPLLVTRGQVGPKVKRLTELLPELDRRYPAIQAVDLRFSRRIVVQPAAPVPQRSGPELRS
ncbi:MAG TPA: FtsQ-type POTRA domain-containing protein [Thermoanaerobaculia bacterium]|nr:FtsQ-type POTRA domain-containing protein [Thermoanaerobaculia bacterium]